MRQLKINKNITNRDSPSLDKYLNEVSRQPMVTAEEEVNLARLIRTGDQQALEKLTNANLRFVVSVAKQFQNQGMSLSDLINEGNIGLIKAARRFDETRGFKFISYAVWWIRQSVMQAIAEKSRTVRLPMNKVGAISKMRKAEARLEQDLERLPTIEELAADMSLRGKELAETMSASARCLSTDMPVYDDGSVFGENLTDKDAIQPDSGLMDDSRSTEVSRALSVLSNMERDIVCLFYGIGVPNPLTLEEIGARYEIGRERVRQIREKAIRRLRHSTGIQNLNIYL
jgi:RNA polymerase primary sigma factor